MSKVKDFNPIKVIKLINKDKLLKKVYELKTSEDYNHNKTLSLAEANKLADETITILQDIYDSIVIQSHQKEYNEIKEKTEVKIKRRYGKNEIKADVEAQDGVATSEQETMLLLADLKAINSTLLDRGVSDIFRGTEKITEANHRTIKSAIRDLKKKLAPVLKSK